MSIYDEYTRRVNNSGSSISDSIVKTAKKYNELNFKDSPFYQEIEIQTKDDKSLYGVRIVEKSKSQEKELLFLPDIKINIGSVPYFNDNYWIVTDFNDNDIFPKANLKLCNTFITLTGKTEQVLIGTDPRTGKPIYKTIVTEPIKIPCVAEKTIYRNATDDAINLPDGQLLITIPYMKHADLTYNKEMIIYDEPYKIINMDDTQSVDGVGIRKITLERVVN